MVAALGYAHLVESLAFETHSLDGFDHRRFTIPTLAEQVLVADWGQFQPSLGSGGPNRIFNAHTEYLILLRF